MTIKIPRASDIGRHFLALLSGFAAAQLYGQTTATPAPTASVLAQYDTNRNGILDPDELAQQRADEARSGAVVQLTPFEVSTDKDVGYAAGNTLSGGRVDTPLAITPASISVMTKEFLDDFNITNINDAAQWTVGMELASITPNSTTNTDATYQAIFRGAPAEGNFPTRDGNLNFGIADSYNSERFEFSRGPDATMFGDGGPGGRQGSSSKRGRFNTTATSITGQIDSYGGYRSTLDYNKGWERLALRLNLLAENSKPYQADRNRFKHGATISGIFEITENTFLNASFEKVTENRSIYGSSIGDQNLYWDSVTVNEDNSSLGTGTALTSRGIEQISATNDRFTWVFGLDELINYKGNQYRTRGTGFRIPFTGNPHIPDSATRSFPSGISRSFGLAAEDQIIDRDGQTLSLSLDHRIGNLNMQVGYTQNMYDISARYMTGTPNEARIDINRLLPDGRPNPNFLRMYADVGGQSQNYSEDSVKEVRAMASYRFFVPRFFDYKQMLTVNTSYRMTKNERLTQSWRRIDNPLQPDPFNSVNQLFFRRYWDDPIQHYSPLMDNPNAFLPGEWAEVQTAGDKTDRTLKAISLFSQSAFLNEKLALSASIRRDDSDVESLPRFGHTGAPYYRNVLGDGAPGVKRIRSGGKQSTAYGMVVYPFPEGSPRWLSPIGFVVNYSENSQQPSTGNANPLPNGEPAPASDARTLDFGLRYAVPGGRMYLTVSHYNTDERNRVSGFGNQAQIRNIWLNLGYTDPALTTNEFSYSDLSDRKLEGWEVELTANPTRNITMTANYSHPINYVQSESVFRKAYVAEHMAEWQAGAALGNDVEVPNSGGRRTLDTQIVRDSIQAIENSLNGLTTGTLQDNTPRHVINVSGRYAFREGRLRGLAVVAGANYRGHTKYGSRDARIKFGLPDNVAPTIEQTTEAAFDYLWVPPSYQFTAGANYTRRFGKYQVRFQLNVTNLVDKKKPIWGRHTAGGGAYATLTTNQLLNGNPRQQVLSGFTSLDPRKFTFSTTVSF